MIPIPLRQAAQAMQAAEPEAIDQKAVQRVTTDSRDVRPGDLFFALRGERFDGHDYVNDAAAKGAVACVVARDWFQQATPQHPRRNGTPRRANPIPLLRVDDTVQALGRLAANYRRTLLPAGCIVVAITGSNGKTTTKCMLQHVLGSALPGRSAPKSFNNHVGVPLTLLSADADDRFVVVEIGTNAPGEIAHLSEITSPSAGVITSIGQAHLEGFHALDAVAREKASLLRHVRSGGLAVVNVDALEIRPFLRRITHVIPICYGFDHWAQRRIVVVEAMLQGTTFILDGRYRIVLNIPGEHHASNAAAAFFIARWFGLQTKEIIERLATFTSPEGRTRTIDARGLKIIDDAYNANPTSMTAAVRALGRSRSRRRVFVMGDMLELGPQSPRLHHNVADDAIRTGIEVLVAVGPEATQAVAAAKAATPGPTRVEACQDVDAANDLLDDLLKPGDLVWVKGSRAMKLDRVVAHLAGEPWAHAEAMRTTQPPRPSPDPPASRGLQPARTPVDPTRQ